MSSQNEVTSEVQRGGSFRPAQKPIPPGPKAITVELSAATYTKFVDVVAMRLGGSVEECVTVAIEELSAAPVEALEFLAARRNASGRRQSGASTAFKAFDDGIRQTHLEHRRADARASAAEAFVSSAKP